MMYNDLLSWFGNVLNFMVVIAIIRFTFDGGCFSGYHTILSASALLISVLINLRTSLSKT